MKTSNRAKQWNEVALFVALLLMLFLPAAGKLRSPGTVCNEWFICAFTAAGLLFLSGYGLKTLWRERWTKRLGLYVSCGVAIGTCFMLLNIWQEQRQFDYWAHRGMSYFIPLADQAHE